jgi:SAM-dependent methyltransferase
MVEPRYAWRATTRTDDGHRNGGRAEVTANEGQRRQWNDDVRLSAWRHREPMTAGVTAVLLEHAGLQAGEKVLDVGSGSGRSAIAAAHQVGPPGEVAGADISERLVAPASCLREVMPSLENTLAKWYSTVCRLMNNRVAISGFERPLLASCAI